MGKIGYLLIASGGVTALVAAAMEGAIAFATTAFALGVLCLMLSWD